MRRILHVVFAVMMMAGMGLVWAADEPAKAPVTTTGTTYPAKSKPAAKSQHKKPRKKHKPAAPSTTTTTTPSTQSATQSGGIK